MIRIGRSASRAGGSVFRVVEGCPEGPAGRMRIMIRIAPGHGLFR